MTGKIMTEKKTEPQIKEVPIYVPNLPIQIRAGTFFFVMENKKHIVIKEENVNGKVICDHATNENEAHEIIDRYLGRFSQPVKYVKHMKIYGYDERFVFTFKEEEGKGYWNGRYSTLEDAIEPKKSILAELKKRRDEEKNERKYGMKIKQIKVDKFEVV